MKNIINIMRKEFARFFTDRSMLMSTILSAVAMYVIYSFMGTVMGNFFGPDEDHVAAIYIVNRAPAVEMMASAAEMTVTHIEANEVDSVKLRIENGDADLLVIFPPNFEADVQVFDPQTATGYAPNVEMFFNSTEPNSSMAFHGFTMILDAYEASMANRFDINRGVSGDIATDEEVAATMIASMMPLLLMIFLYSSCMSLVLESIAGEKERGTLATLLVSPLKRRELAIGKIISLAVLSLFSGVLMAVATILALPNMMGGGDMVDVNIYGATEYALLLLVIIGTLLMITAILSIVSAFAKSVKQAGTFASPLMVLVMVVGVTGMFGGAPDNPLLYLIPFYGSVQSMGGIFSLNYSTTNVLIASVSSILYAGLGGVALSIMFNNEKVMFSK